MHEDSQEQTQVQEPDVNEATEATAEVGQVEVQTEAADEATEEKAEDEAEKPAEA
jgi:hypothetical protein